MDSQKGIGLNATTSGEWGSWQGERQNRAARCHRDILFSVERIGHWRCLPELVRLKVPEAFSRPRVQSGKRAAVLADEHQAAFRRQDATPGIRGSDLRMLPYDLACLS